MRRLNIRKRNRIEFKNLNKKATKIIIILFILIFILLILYLYFFQNFFIKNNFEKEYTYLSELNEETVFSLDKIVVFSSATAQSKEVNNSVWNLDISQYSDIGIYFKNINSNQPEKNIVKELYIDNISISQTEYGTPCLYKKSIQDFGKCTFSENLIIPDKLDFNIVETDSEIDNNENTIYNNLSSPITIGYYNKNVKENFLSADSVIEYNGKILKRATIPQTSIKCNISFSVRIVNALNEQYICNINIDIPFENGTDSIYEDGYIVKEIDNLENYKFLRVK